MRDIAVVLVPSGGFSKIRALATERRLSRGHNFGRRGDDARPRRVARSQPRQRAGQNKAADELARSTTVLKEPGFAQCRPVVEERRVPGDQRGEHHQHEENRHPLRAARAQSRRRAEHNRLAIGFVRSMNALIEPGLAQNEAVLEERHVKGGQHGVLHGENRRSPGAPRDQPRRRARPNGPVIWSKYHTNVFFQCGFAQNRPVVEGRRVPGGQRRRSTW